MSDLSAKLRVTEIFHSIQGESSRAGLPTVFVRLTGCPLRCEWCDTAYAFTEGETMTIGEVLLEAARHGTRYVCVTGGEPLAQKNCLGLLAALADAGYAVSLETSGALDVAGVDPRVSRIMDLKAPDSGESDKNRWENLARLTLQDEIKLVLASERDYEWARRVLREHRLDAICPVLVSPVAGRLEPARLAEWVLRDRLPVRLQVQLHKVIWGAERGR
jgi:7-carboxy-7-deazaguanine synthase